LVFAMNKKAYSPIKQQQVSTLVFEQLRDNIFRGQLRPGERLPPERELANTLKVSRTSVRNAITQLITMGYLESHQGRGTIVVDRRRTDTNNPYAKAIRPGYSTIDELLEYRIGIGTHGVALAAERATTSDIKFLESVLEGAGRRGVDAQAETEADIAFHMGIAYATHNSVYVDLTRQFYEYMFFRLKDLHLLLYEVKANLDQIEQQHLSILAGIKAHDPAAARSSILEHIQFLRDFLREHHAV
jgi:GntR family transcriptional regulator, transcriptional repressor for pyruvate dehydrogenase complex